MVYLLKSENRIMVDIFLWKALPGMHNSTYERENDKNIGQFTVGEIRGI